MKYEYDFSKLRGKIREVCKTEENWCRQMEFSNYTQNSRLNNKLCFKSDEIIKCCEILKIKKEEIGEYFFTVK